VVAAEEGKTVGRRLIEVLERLYTNAATTEADPGVGMPHSPGPLA
jgi:hypothetical protein